MKKKVNNPEYLNSPPMEGWLPLAGGVVNSPTKEIPKADVHRNSKNYFKLPFNKNLKQKARELRKKGNLPEVLLWNKLKNKQFKAYDFDRQKIIGNYIVDFFCTNCNVVIEIDGNSHEGKGAEDAVRDTYMESLGLVVIRIPVVDVLQNLHGVMSMLHHHPALRDNTHSERK